MGRFYKIILITVVCAGISLPAAASRFWVAAGKKIPKDLIVEQLIKKPKALKNLGDKYNDGWSVGYYDRDEPLVFRGSGSAFTDDYFDRAVHDVGDLEPNLVVAHVRRASSGCVKGVNPYPFDRIVGGKTLLFGHDGEIDKKVLMDLIGEEYLAQNPPKYCEANPPDSWIDSELYFIYLAKMIEKSGGQIEEALKVGMHELRSKLPADGRWLNFFLTDGQTVWAYREGSTLFYRYDPKQKFTLVSSSVPDYQEDDWKNFPESVIGVIEPLKETRFVLLTDQTSDVDLETESASSDPQSTP